MIAAAVIAWLRFIVGVQVGLWLARAPRCTCGKTDCGGASLTHVSVWEGETLVILGGEHRDRALTPWQARYLASELYRLSRRIRQRTAEPSA